MEFNHNGAKVSVSESEDCYNPSTITVNGVAFSREWYEKTGYRSAYMTGEGLKFWFATEDDKQFININKKVFVKAHQAEKKAK